MILVKEQGYMGEARCFQLCLTAPRRVAGAKLEYRLMLIVVAFIALLVFVFYLAYTAPGWTEAGSSGAVEKGGVALPLVVGIVVYVVLSVLCGNLLGSSGGLGESIRSDTILCGIVAVLTSWCIDKSSLNRCIYLAAVVAVSSVCALNWEQLLYGAAVAAHLTNVAVIVVAAMRRGKPLSADERVLERGDWAFRLLPAALLAFLAASNSVSAILFLAVGIVYAWKLCKKYVDASRRKVAFGRVVMGICLLTALLWVLMSV